MKQNKILVKRIYEDSAAGDGFRILVDRLWPRGIKKENARLGAWCREIAPSNELRRQFHAAPEQYLRFTKDYMQELDENPASADFIALCQKELKKQNITLLYGSKNEEHNNATVLQAWLQKKR